MEIPIRRVSQPGLDPQAWPAGVKPNRFYELTGAERAAVEVWNRGSADSTGMLCAVRAAVRHTEQRYERSEDARLAALEKAVSDIAGMLDAFDTPRDPGRVRAFVGDLAQILSRIP